jgi:hypothetical protein
MSAISPIHVDHGLTLLIKISFSYDEIEREYASALPLAVGAMAYYDRPRFAFEHIAHGPAQAAACPILHNVISQTSG